MKEKQQNVCNFENTFAMWKNIKDIELKHNILLVYNRDKSSVPVKDDHSPNIGPKRASHLTSK